MSFQAITQVYQDEINEFRDRHIDEETINEVSDILIEYCSEIEERYGVEMDFKVWVEGEGERLMYTVMPVSELDNNLLEMVLKNESSIGPISMMLN